MYYGFALDSWDIDFWNIDLIDTHLDLLDTNIPSKHFVCLQDVFKTCLQDVFSVTILCLPRCLQEKLLHWRRVEDVLKTKKCLLAIFDYTLHRIGF